MITINTRLGEISGLKRGSVFHFRGIRYGEAPIGQRRFLPPVAASGWQGIFDGAAFGNRAMQPTPAEMPDPDARGKVDEDCLFLNIVTPSVEGSDRPVLVWIHGGSFTGGSANDCDGSALAEQGDVVVVAINYRLGLLGFLDLSDYGAELAGSASNGIRDQILALEWVRDNIADYGGNPGNVTIFGNSAGGTSVNCLLASPAADGLYHKAIAHSASVANIPPNNLPPRLSAHLGIEEPELIDALRTMSGEDLLAAQAAIGSNDAHCLDGTVITRSISQAIDECGSAGVPLIAGCNRNEGTVFSAGMTGESLQRTLGRMLAKETMGGGDPTEYLEALKAAYPEDTPKAHFERIWVDLFRRPSVYTTEMATAAGSGGWLYRFDLVSSRYPEFGAAHGTEVAFTFNTYANPEAADQAFHDAEDPAVRRLALNWSNTIIAFARTGNPNDAGLPEWPRYSSDDRRSMILDSSPRIANDLDAKHQVLWGDR
jgi:para-nitrobenzyl esterase